MSWCVCACGLRIGGQKEKTSAIGDGQMAWSNNVDVVASPSRQTRAMARQNGGLEFEKLVWSTRKSPERRVMGLEMRGTPQNKFVNRAADQNFVAKARSRCERGGNWTDEDDASEEEGKQSAIEDEEGEDIQSSPLTDHRTKTKVSGIRDGMERPTQTRIEATSEDRRQTSEWRKIRQSSSTGNTRPLPRESNATKVKSRSDDQGDREKIFDSAEQMHSRPSSPIKRGKESAPTSQRSELPRRTPSPTKATVTIPKPFKFTERSRPSPQKSAPVSQQATAQGLVGSFPPTRSSSPDKNAMMPHHSTTSTRRPTQRQNVQSPATLAPLAKKEVEPSQRVLPEPKSVPPGNPQIVEPSRARNSQEGGMQRNAEARSGRIQSREEATSHRLARPANVEQTVIDKSSESRDQARGSGKVVINPTVARGPSHGISSFAQPASRAAPQLSLERGKRNSLLTRPPKASVKEERRVDERVALNGSKASTKSENGNDKETGATTPTKPLHDSSTEDTLAEGKQGSYCEQTTPTAPMSDPDGSPLASPAALSEETTNALASLEATLARLRSRSDKLRLQRASRKDREKDHETDAALAVLGHRRSPSKSPEASTRKVRSLSPSKEMKEQRRQTLFSDDDTGQYREDRVPSSFLDRVRAAQTRGEAEGTCSVKATSADDGRARSSDHSTMKSRRQLDDRNATHAKTSTPSRIYSDTARGIPHEDDKELSTKDEKMAKRRSAILTYIPSTKAQDSSPTHASKDVSIENPFVSGRQSARPLNIATPVSQQKKGERQSRHFLAGLVVLVDVREQDGDDASSTWVEMLRSMGAKVMVRASERRLSHIVFKSGKPATLHHFRAQPDPKPLLVGVNWVLRCAEEGKKVLEEDYLVEVGKQAIFQHRRRRSSMAPKMAPEESEDDESTLDSHSVQAEVMPPPPPPPPPSIKGASEAVLKSRRRSLHAPPVPSPLAKRAWNMDSSTDSTAVLQEPDLTPNTVSSTP